MKRLPLRYECEIWGTRTISIDADIAATLNLTSGDEITMDQSLDLLSAQYQRSVEQLAQTVARRKSVAPHQPTE